MGSLEMLHLFKMDLLNGILWIWMGACLAPSHYLNLFQLIVNQNLRDIIQWNGIENAKVFIKKNTFEDIISKMSAIFLSLNVLRKDPKD